MNSCSTGPEHTLICSGNKEISLRSLCVRQLLGVLCCYPPGQGKAAPKSVFSRASLGLKMFFSSGPSLAPGEQLFLFSIFAVILLWFCSAFSLFVLCSPLVVKRLYGKDATKCNCFGPLLCSWFQTVGRRRQAFIISPVSPLYLPGISPMDRGAGTC